MPAPARTRISIGQALAQLRSEFPDADIKESKIRFLESEGLVEPDRTPSGYRKYSDADMERLRYILRAQREQYLPLRVIKEHLDAIDRGLEPPGGSLAPTVPAVALATDGTPGSEAYRTTASQVRVSRRELMKTAGIEEDQLRELESFGLVRPRSGSAYYDAEAVVIAKTAGELAGFGIEPRHLRAWRTAAEREVGLVAQVVAPIRRSREAGAEGRAEEATSEIAALSVRLHAALVKAALRTTP